MERFLWDPSLETGNPGIDDQHRGMIELARQLDMALSREGGDADAVANAIYGLSDYVIEHFADEEALMAAFNYPHLGEHRKLHQELSDQTMKLMTRYFGGEKVVAADIGPFVAEWLRQHIREEDMQFAVSLREHAAED